MELKAVLEPSQVLQIMQLVRKASRIVVVSHKNPDGDAVGASLAMADYLKKLGKSAQVVLPNPSPDFLRWLPGFHSICFFSESPKEARNAIESADLIIQLDYNSLTRIDEIAPIIRNCKATKLLIDHHLNPEKGIADILVSKPEASSTCELVFRVINELGGSDNMSKYAAIAIYCGIMTDTGAFQYNSNDPELFLIVALLLAKGVDKDKIYRNVYNTFSPNRLHFTGYILNEKLKFYHSHRASIFTITREEMKKYQYIRGDSEGLVNMPLKVKGMKLSISLREDTEKDIIRVSLRSYDTFPCNKMAEEFFNGGGHLNASGGELPYPLEEAVKTAEQAIEAYKDLL